MGAKAFFGFFGDGSLVQILLNKNSLPCERSPLRETIIDLRTLFDVLSSVMPVNWRNSGKLLGYQHRKTEELRLSTG